MKNLVLVFLFLCFGLSAFSQEREPVKKSNYQAAARFSGAEVNKMVFTTEIAPQWLRNSNRFWYTFKTPEGTKWYIVDPERKTKELLFDNDYMAAELTRIMKDPYDGQNLPFKSFRFTADEKAIRFNLTHSVEEEEELNWNTGKTGKVKKKYYFEYDLAKRELRHLDGYKPETTKALGKVSPDGRYVIFAKDFNLWYMDRENFDKYKVNKTDSTIVDHQLTFDGERDWGFGDSKWDSNEDVEKARTERKYYDNMVWSPDSRNFLVMRVDYRNVEDLWVIQNTGGKRPVLHSYKYQMPGEKEMPRYHLYIVDMETKQIREVDMAAFKDQEAWFIKDDKPHQIIRDDYITNVDVWLGGNDDFFFYRLSRDLKRRDICRVDVGTLTPKVIVEERFNTYLETRPIKLTNGPGSDIVYWSEEDGWAHLYLYGWDGERKRQLTSGPWHVEQVVGIDPAAKWIYFTANGKEKDINPYYHFLYRVNFDGSGLKLLSPGDCSHTISMQDRMKYYVDYSSRVDMTPVTNLHDATGRKVMQLEEADLSQLFAAGYKFPEPFKVKAADGVTDLYGVLYLPFDFDESKLYPVVTYVYPGPQVEGVQYRYTKPNYRLDQLAQLGFVVVTVGNRGGHPARSKWYHTYGYGNLRDYGLADKKAAIMQLADRHPYMDISRVGITGHSGGGFMSTAAILQYPDFFKVAVSSAGNHDNNIYNRRWSEKHHGITEEMSAKSDTTFKFSIETNQKLAENLKGRLLLVTGDVDDNVHPANTMRMVEALIKANKRFDMLVLPGQSHGFGGKMSDYFFWRMADYFCRYLMGDWEDSVDIPQLSE